MPFYDNNLNYNRNFKKEFQYDNLKQRSSGLGFFVFAYSLTMTVSAMIVVEVFKAFGSAKYIYSDNYSILTYFMDIFISVFAVVVPAFFYIKLSRNSLNDIISTKYVKQKSMIPILFLGMGVSTWRCASRVVRSSNKNSQSGMQNITLAEMTKVSLVGYAVGGAFLELAYFDMPYYLMLAIAKLDKLTGQAQSEQEGKRGATT